MNREVLLLVDALGREKSVPEQVVFSALEMALASAVKKRFPEEEVDVRVEIDRTTGEHSVFRRWQVVADDDLEDPAYQIQLSQNLKQGRTEAVGEYIEVLLSDINFGRISAQTAKQVILQKIREAEREQILKDFLDRGEFIITGNVKRIERHHILIESGRIEVYLPRDQVIPGEFLRIGDRIRTYLAKIDRGPRGTKLIASRIAPEFLIKLFELEVPEIEEGLLQIQSAARDPGIRAKVAVKSNDPRIDPVGTCVGIRGSRIQAVMSEIAGERIDVIIWSSEPAKFVINALAPAEVHSIVIDEEKHSMDVIVDENQLAQVIGRNGQNVRLASELTGWVLNIMTTNQAEEKKEQEIASFIQLFVDKLEISPDIAHILVEEGFSALEEIAYVPLQEMLDIPNLDEATVNDLRQRARNILLTEAITSDKKTENSNLLSVEGMNETIAHLLFSKGITDSEALAELSTDDLKDLVNVNEDVAKQIILSARAPWFTH